MSAKGIIAGTIVNRKKQVHIAVVILTILMIPGALKALEPIDMESYDMESPESVSYTHLTLPTICSV